MQYEGHGFHGVAMAIHVMLNLVLSAVEGASEESFP
jgi:hypothetical protein